MESTFIEELFVSYFNFRFVKAAMTFPEHSPPLTLYLLTCVMGESSRRLVRVAPVPWPSKVTHPGSPPNWEMFSCRMVAIVS